jgi:hypothetical protein
MIKLEFNMFYKKELNDAEKGKNESFSGNRMTGLCMFKSSVSIKLRFTLS